MISAGQTSTPTTSLLLLRQLVLNHEENAPAFISMVMALAAVTLAWAHWLDVLCWVALVVMAFVIARVVHRAFLAAWPNIDADGERRWLRRIQATRGLFTLCWSTYVVFGWGGGDVSNVFALFVIAASLAANLSLSGVDARVYVVEAAIAATMTVSRCVVEASPAYYALAVMAVFYTGYLALNARRIERTASQAFVLQADLVRAREEAQKASRAKSEFLAMMSHELRTPLNSILGFSDLLRQSPDYPPGSPSRTYAEHIHKSGSHLLSLISDLLDLSKIEAGRMELHHDIVDPNDLGEASLALVRGMASERGIRLDNGIGRDAPAIWADERAAKQMVVNLLSNAVKFTPEGGTVTLSVQAVPGGTEIQVSDDGIGMSAAEIARALERFGQVDNVLTRRQQGTGLGLNIVDHLARMHGGRLSITSETGVGTVASLFFPNRPPA